jgi:hypothetical protein
MRDQKSLLHERAFQRSIRLPLRYRFCIFFRIRFHQKSSTLARRGSRWERDESKGGQLTADARVETKL